MQPRIAEIVELAEQRGCPIWQIVVEGETQRQSIEQEQLWRQMGSYWDVMCQSIEEGLKPGSKSLSGLVGEEAALLQKYAAAGQALAGETINMAAARALSVTIVNASMGRIVAAPTAGSCGILPSVLMTTAERVGADREAIIAALFTAAGIGMVIDEVLSTSGARAGCQAECGAATGMAAAAAVELAGGQARKAAHAAAIALKSIIGLVCDPVAGLVEVPCVKRNAIGAGTALLAADMALAGIKSVVPLDEVISAMKEVGDALPCSLKETAQGGLANTPTAREIEKNILKP